MKRTLLLLIVALCLGVFLQFSLFLAPVRAQSIKQPTLVEASVLNIRNTKSRNTQNGGFVKQVTIKIVSGDLRDKVFTVEDNNFQTPSELKYNKGDHVIITLSQGPDGKNNLLITDVDRKPMLLLLLFLFITAILWVARWQGVSSIIGMAISFFVISTIIIPQIMAGNDPLFITFFGALIIIPSTYYLSHGFNKKTTLAIVGTLITLLLTIGLAYLFTFLTKLTGFASEEAVYLQNNSLTGNIDIKSLLLAGIVIGSLAVLNDITISQTSTVESLLKANNKLSFKELYSHAMSVGRDHVASLVNTLVLVYVGASFPLVILFYNSPISFGLIANQEIIATEIVRTLVSSIGIVAAVPITTYLGCLFIRKK